MAIGTKVNPITQKKERFVIMPSEQGCRLSVSEQDKTELTQRRIVEDSETRDRLEIVPVNVSISSER